MYIFLQLQLLYWPNQMRRFTIIIIYFSKRKTMINEKINYLTKEDIQNAHHRIKLYIHKTPIFTNTYLNTLSSANIFFKCQNFQKTGSFKIRGAANKILQVDNPKMLCAHSSGNHAQAVAYIANKLNIKCCIVMPNDTPLVKVNAVKGYNADVVFSGPTGKQQQEMSSKLTKELDASFIHPYDDLKIIAGTATSSYELYSDIKNLDYLVVPIGGGGLCSGSLFATKHFSPKTQVIGVQPYLARQAKDSITKGTLQPQYPPLTLAQGVRASISQLTLRILKQYLSDIILVQENEIIAAARLLIQRMKLVVELSGAMVLAAILKDPRFKGKRIGAILSGGNMDLSTYFSFMNQKASSLPKL